MTQKLRAAIFDLDNTLLDHQHANRFGLKGLQRLFSELSKISEAELEQKFEIILHSSFADVLAGRKSVAASRRERIQRLLGLYGRKISESDAQDGVEAYMTDYQQGQRLIPGTIGLLDGLMAQGVTLGMITNGINPIQQNKLDRHGLNAYFPNPVIAGEVKLEKPSKAIFDLALQIADSSAAEAVYVGDHWEADILGAHNAGIRAVYLNRYGWDLPNPEICTMVTGWEPVEESLRILMGEE